MKYAVCVVTPPDYPHSEAFREVAVTLHDGLLALGHDVILADGPASPGRRVIVLGVNLLRHATSAVAADSILYNLEQVSPESPWFPAQSIEQLRRRQVWDYSERNIAALADLGIRGVRHVPIGYVAALTRIAATAEDIDVLFVGSLNERRLHVLEALRLRGLRVEAVFGVYGAARDALIARARIVLNIHFYAARVFEVVRVSYLLANRRFVVSEHGADLDEEGAFSEGVAFAEYDELVDSCVHYLERPVLRQRIAAQGLALMQGRDVRPYLRRALDA